MISGGTIGYLSSKSCLLQSLTKCLYVSSTPIFLSFLLAHEYDVLFHVIFQGQKLRFVVFATAARPLRIRFLLWRYYEYWPRGIVYGPRGIIYGPHKILIRFLKRGVSAFVMPVLFIFICSGKNHSALRVPLVGGFSHSFSA